MIVEMNDVFRANDALGIVESECGKRVVILPPDCGQPVILEDIAAAIWYSIDAVNTVEEIARSFASEYGIDIAIVRWQIQEFIQQLLEFNITVKI
ncbi:PqqD family protein [Arthrobacter psychrolactophilus]|nr:PqqD family protein [Arthrobacter psychrolactophilus]